MLSLKILKEKLPQCCDIDSFHRCELTEIEQQQLKEYLPGVKTVIVLAHHVQHSLEWTWFKFESARDGATPPADLHLKSEAQNIVHLLEKSGYQSAILPYPNRCGVRFKDMANKTGLGKIGDNFLFLHKEWGAWTHLRIVLTDAEITDNLDACDEVCNHCGACAEACPTNAIKEDKLLGKECGAYQHTVYQQFDAYEFQCEVCVRACPIGVAPKPVQII